MAPVANFAENFIYSFPAAMKTIRVIYNMMILLVEFSNGNML